MDHCHNGWSICQQSGRLGFNPRLSHTKDLKQYLMPHSFIRYGSRVSGGNPGNGVVPSPRLQCSSYWKGRFWVTLDNGRPTYIFSYIYIYIYILGEEMKLLQIIDKYISYLGQIFCILCIPDSSWTFNIRQVEIHLSR